MWLEKAANAGFEELAILSHAPMDEARVTQYPVYLEGGLDALLNLVAPDERWSLVESATIRAVKPNRGGTPARHDSPAVCPP